MTTTPERLALGDRILRLAQDYRMADYSAAALVAIDLTSAIDALAASPAAGGGRALKSDEWQGGLTNDELRAALQSKLRPGFTVDDDDLPPFALGIEYALAATPPAAVAAADSNGTAP